MTSISAKRQITTNIKPKQKNLLLIGYLTKTQAFGQWVWKINWKQISTINTERNSFMNIAIMEVELAVWQLNALLTRI